MNFINFFMLLTCYLCYTDAQGRINTGCDITLATELKSINAEDKRKLFNCIPGMYLNMHKFVLNLKNEIIILMPDAYVQPSIAYSIKALANNKFITAEAAGMRELRANRLSANLWELFYLEENYDGTYSLEALVNNKYVCTFF